MEKKKPRYNGAWYLCNNSMFLNCSQNLTFFFWFIPVLRFVSTFLEVTTTRVLYRSGLLGQKRREVSLTQIKDVQLTRGRSISIVVEGQEPFVITGIPKHKMVAVEIDRLAAAI